MQRPLPAIVLTAAGVALGIVSSLALILLGCQASMSSFC